jgi:hypothetical protein
MVLIGSNDPPAEAGFCFSSCAEITHVGFKRMAFRGAECSGLLTSRSRTRDALVLCLFIKRRRLLSSRAGTSPVKARCIGIAVEKGLRAMAKDLPREEERRGTGNVFMWGVVFAAVLFVGLIAIFVLGPL